MIRRIFILTACTFFLTIGAFAQVGSLVGTVLLPRDGGPAEGATVSLFSAANQGDSLTTMTDDQGRFAFEAVAVGEWHVVAALADYLPVIGMVRIEEGAEAEITLTLRARPTGYGRVEGTVQLPNQEGPAAGATVVLFRARGDSLVAETDEQGWFGLDSARIGRHDIYAMLDGYAATHVHIHVIDADTAHIAMTLRPRPTGYGRVEGTVQLPNQEGVAAGATVVLFRARGDSLVAETDEQGSFAFDSARVGTHDIYATLEGFRATHRKVRVLDARTVQMAMTLRRIPTGFGRVVGVAQLPNQEGPAAGASVILYRARGDSLVTESDDNGNFAFDSARVGTHDIIVRKAGYWAGYNHVRVPDAQTVEITMTLRAVPNGIGRVEGVVFLPDRAGVAAGATVVIFRARGDSLVTVADDSGHFAIDSARIGRHDMMAYLDGYARAHLIARVLENQVINVHLVLRQPGRDGDGDEEYVDGDASQLPLDHLIAESYPNPFNPVATIRFAVPVAGDVRLTVYDLAGRAVTTLVNGYHPIGEYSVLFDAAALPNGMYIYRLQSDNAQFTGRLIFQK